jgi:hypothetical protein
MMDTRCFPDNQNDLPRVAPMARQPRRIPRPLFLALFLMAGCVPSATTPQDSYDLLPHGSTAHAERIHLDAAGKASFTATVSTPQQVDVYDVGPVEPGDRLVLTVSALQGSVLDPVAALFDVNVVLINCSDDVDLAHGHYSSHIDHLVRHATSHCYIAVTDSAHHPDSGRYALDLQVIRGGTVPSPQGQVVVLNFGGATVSIPGDRTYTVSPFDAGQADPRLTGQEDTVEQALLAGLRDRYAGYAIQFLMQDDPNVPADGNYSMIVFGGLYPTLFGVSQEVDPYNGNQRDVSIIFTDGWIYAFNSTPTTSRIMTSLANLAAHELGHLLGLQHTADVMELMDNSGSVDTLLDPQTFHKAPLFSGVFPLGSQDGPSLLVDILGPAPGAP